MWWQDDHQDWFLFKFPWLYLTSYLFFTIPVAAKTEEYKKLEKVRDSSKALLDHVNTAIKECENQQYLIDISKKIDKGPLERSNNEIVKEYKVRAVL